MGEYFEIALYDKDIEKASINFKKLQDLFNLYDYHNAPCSRPFPLMSGREMCVYSTEYSDFAEHMICFADLKFEECSFDKTVKELTEIIDKCFDTVPSLKFATAILSLQDTILRKMPPFRIWKIIQYKNFRSVFTGLMISARTNQVNIFQKIPYSFITVKHRIYSHKEKLEKYTAQLRNIEEMIVAL